MVGERAAARRLLDQGVDIEELKLDNLDEPLVYDLFGVDEHIGGLGGGHYRAYTSNHLTNKWYHFDDSYVTPAQASNSVVYFLYLGFPTFLNLFVSRMPTRISCSIDAGVTPLLVAKAFTRLKRLSSSLRMLKSTRLRL